MPTATKTRKHKNAEHRIGGRRFPSYERFEADLHATAALLHYLAKEEQGWSVEQ